MLVAIPVVIDVTGESFLRGIAQMHAILRRLRVRRRRWRVFGGLCTDELLWLGTAYAADHGI